MGVRATTRRGVPPAKRKTKVLRGDIQGLRAVAVLTVFADHLFGWPAGGFIGVDIFFVISGFLITGILLREFARTGTISFTNFYLRRVRRILPAAVVTLVITVTLSFLLFPRSKAEGVWWDGVAAFFFAGNWRFAATGTDYFSQGAPSPLQHFWSLSVEEQFYFVWPWVMLGIILVAIKVTRRSTEAAFRTAGLFMLLVIAASFIYAMYASTASPTAAYFSTLTRVWELGAGAALAIFSSSIPKMPMAIRVLLAWGGLAVITAGLVLITPESVFPAPWALVPVIGAVLVILAGTGVEPKGNVLLSNPVSRYIGDISYSLYLWHFPVIILGGALFPNQDVWYYLGASIVGIVLAILSYELIERTAMDSPLLTVYRDKHERRGAWSRWQMTHRDRVRFTTIAVLLPTVVAILAIVWVAPPQALSDEQVAQIEAQNRADSQGGDQSTYVATGELNQAVYDALSLTMWPEQLTPSIDTVADEGRPEEDFFNCNDAQSEQCVFGEGEFKILVYGDSLGTTLLPTIRSAYPESTIRGYTQAACAVTSLDVTWRSDAEREDCINHRDRARDVVSSFEPDVVLVIQSYGWADRLVSAARGEDLKVEWQAADVALGKDLTALGAKNVVFVSAPPQGKSVTDCASATSTPQDCTTDVPTYWPQVLNAQATSEFALLDQSDWFCADGRCPVVAGSMLIRRDHIHPTRQYAITFADEFRARADELVAVP